MNGNGIALARKKDDFVGCGIGAGDPWQ